MQKNYSSAEASIFLRYITSANRCAFIFSMALLAAYGLMPLIIAAIYDTNSNFVKIAGMAGIAVMVLMIGAHTPLLDSLLNGNISRFKIDAVSFCYFIWAIFILFVFVAWGTASQIPLVAFLGGADPDEIAALREQFLKAREGWESALVYVNAILSGALIPYSLALMFVKEMRFRWFAAGFFLVFCISFVEKAFFLKAALPLLYLVAQGRVSIVISPRALIICIACLLFILTLVSGGGGLGDQSEGSFFSATYIPNSGIEHLLWRSLSIPLVTAVDALSLHESDFGGQSLMGATSSFIAGVGGFERIEFERLVFAAQWGQNEMGTGSANSVYFTESYINFGWTGVVVFSFVIGLLMRLFALSRDEAFRSLWLLFVMGLYSAGLVGMLLSNGFALLFIVALFVRIKDDKKHFKSA